MLTKLSVMIRSPLGLQQCFGEYSIEAIGMNGRNTRYHSYQENYSYESCSACVNSTDGLTKFVENNAGVIGQDFWREN